MKRMGYIGDGHLGKGTDIIEPLVVQFRSNKSKIGVGYGGQDKVKTSSEAFPKHSDPCSSTLVWVPKQNDGYSSIAAIIINVNLSLSGSHPMKESSINTSNNEDDDDSTKWEFESLSKESLHDKECDVVHMLTSNSLTTQGTTSSLRYTSPRIRIQHSSLEDDEHVEGF